MQPETSNSTTNAILVILLVIIVGFAVWFVMDRRAPAAVDDTNNGAGLEINLNGGGDEKVPAN